MVRQAATMTVLLVLPSEPKIQSFFISRSQSFLTQSSSPAVAEGVAAVAERLGCPHRLPHHVVLALHVVQLVLRGAAPGYHRPT